MMSSGLKVLSTRKDRECRPTWSGVNKSQLGREPICDDLRMPTITMFNPVIVKRNYSASVLLNLSSKFSMFESFGDVEASSIPWKSGDCDIIALAT